MDRSNTKNFSRMASRMTRRTVALLGLASACLCLAPVASAQGPLPNSPTLPAPYQSPLFHNGGAADPATLGVPSFLDGQLQGTPTGPVTVGAIQIQTQIPSFLLGAYDPQLPPGGLALGTIGHYPEHFADGDTTSNGKFEWDAPFDYVSVFSGTVNVDDSAPAFTPTTSGYLSTGGFTNSANAPAAATATNGEYQILAPGAVGTATWQLVDTSAGNYSVYFHIPNDVPDINGNAEVRGQQVAYQVVVTDSTGAIKANGGATVSQTEANSAQFLAGPFQLALGDIVTVTLVGNGTNNKNISLVADSMTLQQTVGDVQGSPTAVNWDTYPNDFKRVKYWGIYVPVKGTVLPTGTPQQNGIPDTTGGLTPTTQPLLHYGDPTLPKDEGGILDPRRQIRQLVYFGRTEPVFNRSVTLDDSNAGFTGGGATVTSPSATQGEYKRAGAAVGLGVGSIVSTWVLTAPNPTGATPTNFFVSVHLPATPVGETRVGRVAYTVTVNGVTYGPVRISQVTGTSDNTVTLPTGPILVLPGQQVTVNMYNTTGDTATIPANTYVVSDSVTLSTPPTRGAIYCVDGMTGEVVWRYETPSSSNGPSAPVYSSPAIVKINVLVAPAVPTTNSPAVYANKLVVIVGDNNGLVYCLDAMGNGDGTSNFNVLDADLQPIHITQPAYSPIDPATGFPVTPQLSPTDAGYSPHVGTTGVYWIYRPDGNKPKQITGALAGSLKRTTDDTTDLPIPASFNTSSPVVFVDPNKTGTPDPTTEIVAPVTKNGVLVPPSNAIVYIGNTNGVLYALDATGSGIDDRSLALYDNSGDATQTTPILRNFGDRYNASIDLRLDPTIFPAVAADPIIPTPQPVWWFSLRGLDPNSASSTSSADIESAPALYVKATTPSVAVPAPASNIDYTPTVYIGSAHEIESTSNVGRLYALSGLYGPSGNNGTSDPRNTDPTVTAPVSAAYGGPGSFDYNVGQIPNIPLNSKPADTSAWTFPDASGSATGQNSKGGVLGKGGIRPALGNITGSPVVFTNQHETTLTRQTRIYFGANTGLEIPTGSNSNVPDARPDETQTGRIWAVNLDGSVGTTTNSGAANASNSNVWSYPQANDPNNADKDTVAEPQAPIGAFLHSTPAMGYVTFPQVITTSSGSNYVHQDAVQTDIVAGAGKTSVPMLYIGTAGAADQSLYALDVDGSIDPANATSGSGLGDQRLIYTQISPSGAIYQSSPVLIANASTTGGNGGAIFVTNGNSLYDFSATPVSNPFATPVGLPAGTGAIFVRTNRFYTSWGPYSTPAVSATDVTSLLTAAEFGNYQTATASPSHLGGYPTAVEDWVYGGDSTTGLCRGITPLDGADFGIPSALSQILPPAVDASTSVDLSESLQTYLVDEANNASTKYGDRIAFGAGTTVPAYEWGENVYIRIANVVPPSSAGVPTYVYDQTMNPANPMVVYGNGGPIEFDLSDSSPNAATDHGTIPAQLPNGAANFVPLPANTFAHRTDTDAGTLHKLIDLSPTLTNNGYIAAYTYTIADGSARRNTPGARRKIINCHQLVHKYQWNGTTVTADLGTVDLQADITNGEVVSNQVPATVPGGVPTYTNESIAPVDQPTFAILNPLAIRGGGTDLLGKYGGVAVPMGSALGPFRGIAKPLAPADTTALESLTNGNDVPIKAPPSTGGGGLTDPGHLPRGNYDLIGASIPTNTEIVVTATGLIEHNKSGDNYDAYNIGPLSALPVGRSANGGEGFASPNPNFGIPNAPYAMNLADRSVLYQIGQTLRVKTGTISGGSDGLSWNDNSANLSGHDSVVNFLPWEAAPVGANIGVNPSIDYPDISASHIAAYLHQNGSVIGTDMTLGESFAQQATPGGGTDPLLNRIVNVNPVQFHINIPRFQPANQQLYQEVPNLPQPSYNVGGEIDPTRLNAGDNVFPMGYVTRRRIYIPNRNGLYLEGAAFRDVRIYTGVPPDFGLQMGKPIVDIGQTVPSGFGVQTSASPLYINGANTDFNPYNTAFQNYFQELPIYNTGNVNLMNVRLDQRIAQQDNVNSIFPLLLTSDAADPLSFIPAWDALGVTGANSLSGKNNFLIRSSLDSDIAVVNPVLGGGQYPGPTFHKSRVGDASPTQMTMPDVPHDNNPNNIVNSGYYPTAFTPTDKPVANTGLPLYPSFAAPVYVSVAIPFGTPVGTYHLPRTLQAFEGYDNPLTYNYLFPPRYGGILPGQGAAANSPVHDFLVAPTLPVSGPFLKGASAQHPVSSNGTDIKVSVVEDRMTDGFTNGALPMIDPQGAGPNNAASQPTSTPDFAPAAFRDPFSGNLSLYWTTGRTGSGFGIEAANVTMNPAAVPNGVPYFKPSNPAQNWWNPFAAFSSPSGTNSGLTIAQDPLDAASPSSSANVFAFVVNVQAQLTPTVIPYTNTLFCYPVITPANGQLGTGQAITNDPSQVKYGVKGLYFKSATNFTNNLWAFWTATTRGRSAIYYNSTVASGSGNWPATTGLLPIPAGLTAVSDPAPILLYSPAATGSGFVPAIAVTYSGTGPDGNIDLYESRYVAHGTSPTDISKLDLIPSLPVTETLVKVTGGGWYQARDVAWSRNGALNIAMSNGTAAPTPLLYNGTSPCSAGPCSTKPAAT